jgi:hypothetical protein
MKVSRCIVVNVLETYSKPFEDLVGCNRRQEEGSLLWHRVRLWLRIDSHAVEHHPAIVGHRWVAISSSHLHRAGRHHHRTVCWIKFAKVHVHDIIRRIQQSSMLDLGRHLVMNYSLLILTNDIDTEF